MKKLLFILLLVFISLLIVYGYKTVFLPSSDEYKKAYLASRDYEVVLNDIEYK